MKRSLRNVEMSFSAFVKCEKTYRRRVKWMTDNNVSIHKLNILMWDDVFSLILTRQCVTVVKDFSQMRGRKEERRELKYITYPSRQTWINKRPK